MKAAVNRVYGPPEVVRIEDIPQPVPRDDEVLIRVHASTVNRTDCGFRKGKPWLVRFYSGFPRPRNKVLGNEFAGEIESTGKVVTGFKAGDQVFGYNDLKFGAHAEYLVLAEKEAITTLPAGCTYTESAPISEGAHYALMYIRASGIRGGQKVLVNGATGAIGSAAVQLITAMGADVTAVCHGKHAALVASLGAVKVLDYSKEDFTQLNETFDVVLDAVGKSTFGKCKPLIRRGGCYCSTELGPGWQNPFLAMVTPWLGGKKVLFPIPTISKDDLNYLKGLVETRRFKPLIDRSYPIAKIADAYRYAETGQKTGNLLLNLMAENNIP